MPMQDVLVVILCTGLVIVLDDLFMDIGASRKHSYLKANYPGPSADYQSSTDMDNGYGFSLYLPVKIITSDGTEMMGCISEDYTLYHSDKRCKTIVSFFQIRNCAKSVEKLYAVTYAFL